MKSAALHQGGITYCDAPSLRRLSLLRRTRTSKEIKDDTICSKYYIVKQHHCQGLVFMAVVRRMSGYILPLKTSLNSPGGAWVTKVVTTLTYEGK